MWTVEAYDPTRYLDELNFRLHEALGCEVQIGAWKRLAKLLQTVSSVAREYHDRSSTPTMHMWLIMCDMPELDDHSCACT